MKRLTTDNPSDNVETMLNLFYIKNAETWVRGGGPGPEFQDVSLFDYLREIVKRHNLEIDVSDETAIGLHVYELLFDGIDTLEGIVATLYTAGWAFAELRARLKMYEDICYDVGGYGRIGLDRLMFEDIVNDTKCQERIRKLVADRTGNVSNLDTSSGGGTV